MAQTVKSTPYDPAEDAALLLMRLGFITLFLGIPLGGELGRRSLFLVYPIGVVLSLGSALMVMSRSMRARAFKLRMSFVLAAALSLIFWAVLSLSWSPYWQVALGFVIKALFTGLFAFLTCRALPEHTRSANLYLVSLGLFAAVVIPLVRPMIHLSFSAENLNLDDRAAITLAVMVWPGMAALAIRRHIIWASLLGIGIALLLILTHQLACILIMALATAVYAISTTAQEKLAHWLGLGFGVLILLGPVLILLLGLFASPDSTLGAYSAALRQSLLSDFARLITGRGLGASSHSALGLLDPTAAHWLGFELWFDLGLLGVCAMISLIYSSFIASKQIHPSLYGFVMACMTSIVLFALIGQGFAQIWWLTLLSVTAIAFQAVKNGHYRRHRPGAKNSAPEPAAI